MEPKHARTSLVAGLLMMTGCTSPAETQVTQQQINDALKRAPHGSVELTVDYCSSHQVANRRTQVVDMGQGAVFKPTASAPYELVVTPVQAPSGDLLLSLRSKWMERNATPAGPVNTDVLYAKTALINNGGVSEPITFRVRDAETCLTLTANTRLTVSSANSVESVQQEASGQ
jgi:hypothetical protein